MVTRRARVGCVLAMLLVGAAVIGAVPADDATGAAPAFHAGASGVGDPYYPLAGNGGYDVDHYDLAVRYNPASDRLVGRATIVARATEDLSSFDLDLIGLTVEKVIVDSRRASWTRVGQELVITPRTGIVAGATIRVVVRYSGVPVSLGSVGGGFVPTDDGAIVAGEPTVAPFWYPANDHPSDKASYTFRVTVPNGVDVVANGLPAGVAPAARGWSTHVWEAAEPMATYLTTIDIGRWNITERRDAQGRRVIDAVDPDVASLAAAALDRELEIVSFLEDTFGRYPFSTYGAIVDDYPLFFALETQTRPVYPPFALTPGLGEILLVHELAHQWFGDSVTVAQWRDIWLNEGFATYAEWLWVEHTGGPTAAQLADAAYQENPADSPFWNLVVSDPGSGHEFDDAVHRRGGMALQALRTRVGDAMFFVILRTWAETKAGGNATTAEFISTAESISGRRLGSLFRRWLSRPGRPSRPPGPVVDPAASEARVPGSSQTATPSSPPTSATGSSTTTSTSTTSTSTTSTSTTSTSTPTSSVDTTR